MESIIQFVMSSRYLICYIIGVSFFRGLIVPDFRYGYFSVIVILFLYPISLLLPLLVGKVSHPSYLGYLSLGFLGIALSVVVAACRYVWESTGGSLDSVSSAVFIGSFIAMVALFAITLALIVN